MSEHDNGSKLHCVLIEWDGEKPPTTWYRRLFSMAGIKVRENTAGSNGSLRMLVENAGQRHGIVVQEGAILCASYTLARAIYARALQGFDNVKMKDGTVGTLRPLNVYLGTVEVESTGVNERDLEVLDRMQAVYGKKGKKGQPIERAVTCMEEMTTHNVTSHAVANCPVCGGTQIRVRPGYAFRLADPTGDPVLNAWIRLRFGQSGQWELPEIAPDGMEPAGFFESLAAIKHDGERAYAAVLAGSPLVKQIEMIAGGDRGFAMRLLDAAFVARNYWSPERRVNARLAAVTKYFQLGNMDVTGISLAELPTPDLFDVAGPMGAEVAADLMTRYMAKVRAAAAAPVVVPSLPSFELIAA